MVPVAALARRGLPRLRAGRRRLVAGGAGEGPDHGPRWCAPPTPWQVTVVSGLETARRRAALHPGVQEVARLGSRE